MGEPFDNTLEILRTCEILTADWGFAWSPRRITVSSVGLIPGMKEFLNKTECHLAISLHNPFPDERAQIMPAEKAYSITRVIDEIKKYDWEHQRRISFEYIVFEGLNDMQRHASELVRLLKGFTCRVNLIRWHAIPGMDMHSPNDERMIWLRDYLTDNGVICTIRRSRGEDIMAACGLLSSNHKH
jgi:23S rRNA (adenine2503-C2)-methyltransferase